ncbi:type II toxin-antitoxin system RelE/ParE family toxin [Mongoliibacter ruber]|uniref:mRNA-degrading endonuclease RelE of RelBE toxin-antitoxin system n=1 Tax=Mongoliibacter ruber TaxID=1750599 RepID=A0A2T0WQM6_9BACT|nr:type II toxin-antitoxin system RelE/ParE family toxin [Mongoliibacter ruber]PRY88999.1 hypothetical protein CLW00_103119 [Mongoliibacter ruber]
MSFNVIPTPEFKKLFKRLAKKYPSLKNDLSRLIEILKEKPTIGIPLGHNLFKIRMAISSKGKDKSGGARVITFLINTDNEIFLVHIYDKSQLGNLSKEQIILILKNAGLM